MGKVCVPVMKFLENVQGSRCKKGMYNECNGYQFPNFFLPFKDGKLKSDMTRDISELLE